MEQMTKAQAIENGYTHAQCEDDFRKIQKVEDERLIKDEWVLSSKDISRRHYSGEELFELISDHIECDDRFYDDDAVASDLIKEKVNWELFSQQINKALSTLEYRMPTEIRLVP